MREVPPAGGAGTLRYLLADHLGTTTKVLDANGTVIAEQKYWPFGATRDGGITQTDKLYTGQRQEAVDPDLGLYNYKARFYSTTLGRFVSADPIARGAAGLNRYSYVLNSPMRFTDPSGFECIGFPPNPADCLKDGIKLIVDSARTGVDAIEHGGEWLLHRGGTGARALTGQIGKWAKASFAAIRSLGDEARYSWRLTYPARSPVVRSIEAWAWSGLIWHDKIHTVLNPWEFGLALPFQIVTGCISPLCAAVAALGEKAITIGHTIFTIHSEEWIRNNVVKWLFLLKHEIGHIGQYEDLGDLFLVAYFGEGGYLFLRECLGRGGCSWKDLERVFDETFIERILSPSSAPD